MENDAIQIFSALIPIGGTVIEIPIRLVGELSAELIRNIVSTLWHAGKQSISVQNITRRGACSLEYLMTNKGTELQYCRIPNEQKEEFLKNLEARGGLYTILPDLNPTDNYFEIAFHTTDVAKVNATCADFQIGQAKEASRNGLREGIINYDDYLVNAKKEELDKIQDNFRKDVSKRKKVDAPGEYTISINKSSLLAGEDERYYYSYVPGTYDKMAGGFQEILLIPKEKTTLKQQGQVIEYTMPLKENFAIYDGGTYRKSGKLEQNHQISGEKLSQSYDPARKEAAELTEVIDKKTTITRDFSKDIIEKENENYYVIRPVGQIENRRVIFLPKENVRISEDGTYTAVLKNGKYAAMSYDDFCKGGTEVVKISNVEALAHIGMAEFEVQSLAKDAQKSMDKTISMAQKKVEKL